MPKKIYLDEEKVIDMYLNKKMSSYVIARELDCSGSKILKVLKINNIKLFKQGFFIEGRPPMNRKKVDQEEIVRLYINENMSSYKIGDIFNCSSPTIIKNLKESGVKIKNSSESRIGIKHKNKYTSKQRKARSERVKQDYINHPELRETRSKQFKKNIKEAKENGTFEEIKEKRKKTILESYASGRITIHNKGKESPIKNKTYEEIHGEEKAIKIKKKQSKVQRGRIVTDHTRELSRKANKGKHIGKLNSFYGKRHTEESLKKMRKPSLIKNKTYDEVYGEKKSKEIRAKMKESRKRTIIPKKDTTIEVKIQTFLTQLKIEFFTHQYMKIEHGYQCDILVPSMNLIIECDGDYFHMNPNKFSPNDKIHKNGMTAKEKWHIDKTRTNELVEKGYNVIRLWEHKIRAMNIDQFKSILSPISNR